ncbi:MAG: hypothetical protein ACPG47_06510, partial [Leucothrix sp.]
MNRTTVKRGIGAVILALIAAGLLAFLLKDKAAQRQEVVEISLPGTGISNNANNQATRLPTLTTDNSGNGNVIANAGSGNGTTANNAANLNAASSAASNTQVSNSSGSASSNNNAGTVIASAAAVGAAAVGATSGGTAGNTAKSMDFSV